jgi:hypothetical protein
VQFYDMPLDSIKSPTAKYVISLMDRYRDWRLFYNSIDFILGVVLTIVVLLIFRKLKRIRHEVNRSHDELSSLILDVTKTAKSADRVFRKIDAAESGNGRSHHKFFPNEKVV